MQGAEAPNIQMPPGSKDVIQRPPDKQRADKQRKDPGTSPKKRRSRGSRLQIALGASALSILWLGGYGAFVYGFYAENTVPLISLPPLAWAGLVATALLPLGFIWVGAVVLLRLVDMQEAAMRLAAVSRDLIDPGTTAANDVAKLGAVIRKELEGLNREVDGAVARVGMLEGRLKQQTTLIDETAKRVDKRTREMASFRKLSTHRLTPSMPPLKGRPRPLRKPKIVSRNEPMISTELPVRRPRPPKMSRAILKPKQASSNPSPPMPARAPKRSPRVLPNSTNLWSQRWTSKLSNRPSSNPPWNSSSA